MMIPELFLIVSSVCFGLVNGDISKIDRATKTQQRLIPWAADWGDCVQTVRFSTSSTITEGETAYRVVPATATVCDISGHRWSGEIYQEFSPDRNGKIYLWEICSNCKKRRRKVTKTEWVEE